MAAVLGVRRPAVAGTFYPGEPATLVQLVDRLLVEARQAATPPPPRHCPKALIVPHAGYQYSGPTAAVGYARIASAGRLITRVLLIGPSHHVGFAGLALPGADHLETPLGQVRASAEPVAGVVTHVQAHAKEHSLEVHLPFLQRIFEDIEVVPLLVGKASSEDVAGVLERLWGGAETLVVVSSDLSHYHRWDEAVRLDAHAAAQIEGLGPPLSYEQACGATPVNGLLLVARRRRLRVEVLDLRNSGDTAGPRDRVVGYGAFAFYEPQSGG